MTIDLVEKYNKPGPRYTSYPTVPYWNNDLEPTVWIQQLQQQIALARDKNLGAALYIHIPFCKILCTYCGCNTQVVRNESILADYVDAVLQEWDLYHEHLNLSNPIQLEELHLGGGTPNILPVPILEKLLAGILKRVDVLPDHEFSIEIDPRSTSEEQLQLLYDFGFRRISIGVQDFDPVVMKVVNRVQSVEQVQIATQLARKIGFKSVNFDLIYGLPCQTKDSIKMTFERVRELSPDRIAFYSYAHVPWIKAGQRLFAEEDIPVGVAKRQLYELGRELLLTNGYHEIGMDHFAQEGDTLFISAKQKSLHRNFMGYTNKERIPLMALGASAIGDTWTALAQNEKNYRLYQDKVVNRQFPIIHGHLLNDEDKILRRHILNLMTKMETTWSPTNLWTDWLDKVTPLLNEFKTDGLITLEAGKCQITPLGEPFVRNICMAFDARLASKNPTTNLFSQTI